jgi:hypothetical protein
MPDVLSLFSPPGIIGCIIGVFMSWLYWCYKLHHSGAEKKIPNVSLAWLLSGAMVLSIGYSVYEVRENRLRTETLISCQSELIDAMRVEQALGKQERDSFKNAIADSLRMQAQHPDPNDPIRVAEGKKLTARYLAEQDDVAKKRVVNDARFDRASEKC